MSLNSLECQQNRGDVYGWRRHLPSLSTLSPNPVKCFFMIAGVAFICKFKVILNQLHTKLTRQPWLCETWYPKIQNKKKVINDVQISFEDLMGVLYDVVEC